MENGRDAHPRMHADIHPCYTVGKVQIFLSATSFLRVSKAKKTKIATLAELR